MIERRSNRSASAAWFGEMGSAIFLSSWRDIVEQRVTGEALREAALRTSSELVAASERLAQAFGWGEDCVLAGRATGFWWISDAFAPEPSELFVWLSVHSKNSIELGSADAAPIAGLDAALQGSLADLLFHTLVAGWSANAGVSDVVALVDEVRNAFEPLAIGATGDAKAHEILYSRHVVPAIDYAEKVADISFAVLAREYMRNS